MLSVNASTFRFCSSNLSLHKLFPAALQSATDLNAVSTKTYQHNIAFLNVFIKTPMGFSVLQHHQPAHR